MAKILNNERIGSMLIFRFSFLCLLLFLPSCANTQLGSSSDSLSKNESNLTPGIITTKLKKGESKKSQVMKVFGPPDLITKEGDIEMWGYDKISREVAYGSFGLGFGGGGIAGNALLLGGISGSQGHSSQSNKTVFLLIYFKEDIVVDYKLSVTRF
tara:strand:- start:736 stop:1203 length:468 start_codon:yes stop_codon:yes gene_type:complete